MPQNRRYRRYLLIIGFLTIIPYTRFIIRPFLSNRLDIDSISRTDFPQIRPNITNRRFLSEAVESLIIEIKQNIKNKELAWLFGNCFANTLDMNVNFDEKSAVENRPDTYIIMGDIDAMGLRDSSVQIHSYLPLMKHDFKLRQLVEGVLRRQFLCIQRDPYANAHYKDVTRISEWKDFDQTDMIEGIHERKWELDSLCYVLRLIYSYWIEINYDLTFFLNNKDDFHQTLGLIVQTIKDQRRYNGSGSYTFQRQGKPADPRGTQAKPNGLIYSYFRPNDDPQLYGYFIPAQYFAYNTLTNILKLVQHLNWTDDSIKNNIMSITNDLDDILFDYRLKRNEATLVTAQHQYGLTYTYEIDGIGQQNLMDDSSIPSLLSLPYLCSEQIPLNHSIYQNTRKFVLSRNNPWYYNGYFLQGIGGGHSGYGMVWPLGIIMQGLTSQNDNEIRTCLKMLQISHAGTGLMHESVSVDDPSKYVRHSFPWANSLFGELIWKLYREKRYLLDENHVVKKE